MFEQQVIAGNVFLQDVCALRGSVKNLVEPEASDAGDRVPDPALSIELLQTVLAAEIVCVLRYTMISVSFDGLKNHWIGKEFQAQANDERRHMQMVAERIEKLGGVPNFNPAGLASRIETLVNFDGNLPARIDQNLAAETEIIEHYRDLIQYFSRTDQTSCAMLEEIIRDEEDHTSDMQDLLVSYVG